MKKEIDYGQAKDVVTKAIAIATELSGCTDHYLQVFEDLERYYNMTGAGVSTEDEDSMLRRLCLSIWDLIAICQTRAKVAYKSLKSQLKNTKMSWGSNEHEACLQSLELQHNLESRLYKCLSVAENLTMLRNEIRGFRRNEEGTNDDSIE